MYSKQFVLDYLWQHSRFYYSCLYQSETLYRETKGYAAMMVLFSCIENIAKSALNDYDARAIDIYKALFEAGSISAKEHAFLNDGDFCVRRVRNLYSHANIAAVYMITHENDEELLCSLSEDDTSLLLYHKISDIVFNLILKIISLTFIDEVKDRICVELDEAISNCDLRFKILTSQERLAMRGFPEDYFSGCENIPEHAKIRLLDNAPDIAPLTHLFSTMRDLFD